MASDLEHALYFALRRNKLTGWVAEYRFGGLNGRRKWRFDIGFEEEKVAIECQGGLYANGKHSREKGYRNDAEKSAEAQLMGWKVIAATPSMIKDESVVGLIREALRRKGEG